MSEPSGYPGAPRWVKVFGIIALVVVVLFVHRLLTGGGEHGRHGASDGRGGHNPPSSAMDGHTPPAAGHR